jgi:hypothetical protein
MVQLKRILLHTTALALGLTVPLIMVSHSAKASCSSYAPTSGTTVDCSGTSNTAVLAASGSSNVTINLLDAAVLTQEVRHFAMRVLLQGQSQEAPASIPWKTMASSPD